MARTVERRQVLTVVVAALLVTAGVATTAVPVAAADEAEPNDSRENAQPIAAGEPIDGSAPERTGDTDWFAIEADRGETVNATMAVEATAGDGMVNELRIYDEDGGELARGGANGGTTSVGTTVTEDGTYYVLVRAGLGADGADYTLTVDTYETDLLEPNERLSTATQLFENPFSPDDARLSVGDADFFDYPVEAGEEVELTLGVPEGGAPLYFELYNPDTARMDSNTLSPASTRTVTGSYTAQKSGVGSIWIAPGETGRYGPYNISLTVGGEPLGLPNDRFEVPNPPIGNQDRANATALQPGEYRGLGMVDDDRDVFAVDLDADQRLNVSAAFEHSANDLAVTVSGPDGATLAGSDTADDGEHLAVNASEAGTHYVTVTGEAGAAARYDLAVSVETTETPLAERFDADDDGEVDAREVLSVIAAYNDGRISNPGVVLSVITAFNSEGQSWSAAGG